MRYIDADALKERLEDFSKWCNDGRKEGVDFVLDCPLPNTPTADVVPKGEVEKIFEEIESLLDKHTMLIRTINGLGNMVFSRTLEVDIAELKKKYT